MISDLPENVKMQISLENDKNDKVKQTTLLNKFEMIEQLSEWVGLFTDYDDMDINDITFKLLKIEIPTGAGKRVNRIITVDDKRSIIQIRNSDTLCLARSIVVGLVSKEKQHLESILKGKLTTDEMQQMNKDRQFKSQINEGIISNNEEVNIVQGRKIQGILAKVLHRLYKIPEKENGNDFADMPKFEDGLDIEIQVFDFTTRQIYKSQTEKPIKVYLAMTENHFHTISNISGFTCEREDNRNAAIEITNVKLARIRLNVIRKNVWWNVQNVLNYFTANNVLITI